MSEKNRFICAILAAQCGVFGFHRFYVERYLSGAIQLLTFGGLGVWALIDMYKLYTGRFTDSKGLKVNGFFMFNKQTREKIE